MILKLAECLSLARKCLGLIRELRFKFKVRKLKLLRGQDLLRCKN